jgi:hypothetical protein
MAAIDLDARRAARSEAENTPHELIVGGRTYRLKPRMPLEFSDRLTEGKLVAAMQLLLVDPAEWEALRAAELDDADLVAIADLYAVSLPQSPGSATSSTNGGPSSKPTSSPATPFPWPQPATAPGLSGSAPSSP